MHPLGMEERSVCSHDAQSSVLMHRPQKQEELKKVHVMVAKIIYVLETRRIDF